MEHTFAGLPLPLRIKPPYPLSDDELLRFNFLHKGLPFERDTEGYLLLMTPAGGITGNKNVYITRVLDEWTERDGRGIAFDSNTGFTLPDGSMRSPDGAWILSSRWEQISYEQQIRYAPMCPQFLIELRSESYRLADVEEKMDMWMRNGAELAWLIDPQSRAVTIYRQGRLPERLDTPAKVAGEGPVAGFVLPLDRIFR